MFVYTPAVYILNMQSLFFRYNEMIRIRRFFRKFAETNNTYIIWKA